MLQDFSYLRKALQLKKVSPYSPPCYAEDRLLKKDNPYDPTVLHQSFTMRGQSAHVRQTTGFGCRLRHEGA